MKKVICLYRVSTNKQVNDEEDIPVQIEDYENVAEISNISAIKALIEEGCGITFLYERAVRQELEEGKLVSIPLEDFYVTHDFTFIWRRGSIFSDYYQNLFQMIRG